MKNVIGFDDLVRVEIHPDHDILIIGPDTEPNMQVRYQFPPGHMANVLSGAIQRALLKVAAPPATPPTAEEGRS